MIFPYSFLSKEVHMLTLALPTVDMWDQTNERFIVKGDYGTYQFEHNLKAIAEWESVWKIPFLDDSEKTVDMMKHYAAVMCTQPISPDWIDGQALLRIANYINENKSATTVRNDGSSNKKIITSEVLYGYMSEAQIPFEADTWHLSRLIKLIDVVGSLRNPPKKMSQSEIMEQNRKINEERRRKFKTKG